MLEFKNTKTFWLKDTLQIGQKFVVSKIKKTVPWTYVISYFNGVEKFRIEKVLKRKGDKLYVKWKRYDSRFNSWINKKDLI